MPSGAAVVVAESPTGMECRWYHCGQKMMVFMCVSGESPTGMECRWYHCGQKMMAFMCVSEEWYLLL